MYLKQKEEQAHDIETVIAKDDDISEDNCCVVVLEAVMREDS